MSKFLLNKNMMQKEEADTSLINYIAHSFPGINKQSK